MNRPVWGWTSVIGWFGDEDYRAFENDLEMQLRRPELTDRPKSPQPYGQFGNRRYAAVLLTNVFRLRAVSFGTCRRPLLR